MFGPDFSQLHVGQRPTVGVPRFSGHIYVPIYNFTEAERILEYELSFLSIEFSYTTPLPQSLSRLNSELEIVENGSELQGVAGKPLKLFDANMLRNARPQRGPSFFWGKFPADHSHRSNLEKMDESIKGTRAETKAAIDEFKKELRLGRWIGVGATLALAGLLLQHFYWQEKKFSEIQIEAVRQEVLDLSRRVEALER